MGAMRRRSQLSASPSLPAASAELAPLLHADPFFIRIDHPVHPPAHKPFRRRMDEMLLQ